MSEPADGSAARRLEERLEDVVTTIREFADLHFDARAPVGPDGDIVDAVAAGVNLLGEELDASFKEIERRVADRTAQLALASEELAHRALHDELTGLPNRAVFWEHVGHQFALAGRRETPFAVLFLDLDGFKAVNDTLGHAAGDRLLVDAAGRLTAWLRASDIAARLGGDEFAVQLDDVATGAAAMLVAKRLGDVLQAPYEIGGGPRSVPASIGVAVGPTNFRTADEMIAAADDAMYEAKRRGGGRCVLYGKALAARRGRP